MRPAKIQVSLCIWTLTKKFCILGYPKWAQRRFAQSGLNHRLARISKLTSLTLRLIFGLLWCFIYEIEDPYVNWTHFCNLELCQWRSFDWVNQVLTGWQLFLSDLSKAVLLLQFSCVRMSVCFRLWLLVSFLVFFLGKVVRRNCIIFCFFLFFLLFFFF